MKKTLVLIILYILTINVLTAQDSLFLKLRMNNFDGKEAILFAVKGGEYQAFDTVKGRNNQYIFNHIERFPTGVYRVRFNDTLFTELILNKENIDIETDADEVLRKMKVYQSLENKINFEYWNKAIEIRESMLRLYMEKDEILRTNQGQPNNKTKEIDEKIAGLNDIIYDYVQQLSMQYPDLYVIKLLKAYQKPSYKRYLAQSGNQAYPDEMTFFYYHFFDYIDFSDARLLNSKVIFTAINDYLKSFVGKNPSTEIYNGLIDRVMQHAGQNPEVQKYVINLFIKSFEFSIWRDVFIHVIDDYYLKTIVDNPYLGVFYANKINKMKLVKIGKVMPAVIARDTMENLININSIPAKAKLIVFYSSDCDHCLETLPVLKVIADDYREDGLEVYGVALDDNKALWTSVLHTYKMKWNAVSDLLGMTSPFLENYDIWSTPRMYILDKDNIIRAIPNSESEIHAGLLEVIHIRK